MKKGIGYKASVELPYACGHGTFTIESYRDPEYVQQLVGKSMSKLCKECLRKSQKDEEKTFCFYSASDFMCSCFLIVSGYTYDIKDQLKEKYGRFMVINGRRKWMIPLPSNPSQKVYRNKYINTINFLRKLGFKYIGTYPYLYRY